MKRYLFTISIVACTLAGCVTSESLDNAGTALKEGTEQLLNDVPQALATGDWGSLVVKGVGVLTATGLAFFGVQRYRSRKAKAQ